MLIILSIRETKKTLDSHGFSSLVDEYLQRESNITGAKSSSHPLHTHDLSRTSFEPYSATPAYMRKDQGRELRDYQLTGKNKSYEVLEHFLLQV